MSLGAELIIMYAKNLPRFPGGSVSLGSFSPNSSVIGVITWNYVFPMNSLGDVIRLLLFQRVVQESHLKRR